MNNRPTRIAIDHDEYHAKHIGLTSDGHQFLLTTPFEPAIGNNLGCEFVALYIFNKDGQLLEAKIDSFGPRSSLDENARHKLYNQRLTSLGKVSFERIEIAPFVVEYRGISFGLIIREPEDEDDVFAVEMQPGNYMAFFEPWDSGDYDT